jgi:RimJ/RimL family protein N-acetyltransferase
MNSAAAGIPPSVTFDEVTLMTTRLVLRPYRPSDVAAVARACQDETIQRWLPIPNPYTLEVAAAWCGTLTTSLRQRGAGIEWAAVRAAGGEFVGSFGLKRTDWVARTSEIGYWVAPWARNEGLATEAVIEIGRWLIADQGFERMELRAAPGNLASQRVAEKAGLTREGVARNAGYTHAGRVDLVIFSLTPVDLVT